VFVDDITILNMHFFDIIRSADHLIPGGVMIVDNLEQDGPASCRLLSFIQWNPAWEVNNLKILLYLNFFS